MITFICSLVHMTVSLSSETVKKNSFNTATAVHVHTLLTHFLSFQLLCISYISMYLMHYYIKDTETIVFLSNLELNMIVVEEMLMISL